jgi:hypothetical protein
VRALSGRNWFERDGNLRNSNDATVIQSYRASLSKRDTNSLAVSHLKRACSKLLKSARQPALCAGNQLQFALSQRKSARKIDFFSSLLVSGAASPSTRLAGGLRAVRARCQAPDRTSEIVMARPGARLIARAGKLVLSSLSAFSLTIGGRLSRVTISSRRGGRPSRRDVPNRRRVRPSRRDVSCRRAASDTRSFLRARIMQH